MTPLNQDIANRISDQFKIEDCYDIDQFAKELGVSVMRVRQLLAEGKKKRRVQNLAKRGADGRRLYYPQPMVDQLKKFWKSEYTSAITAPRTIDTVQKAELKLEVPVFDPETKAILMQKFGTEQKLVEFLKEKIAETVKPLQNELQNLERDYLAKRAALLSA